jgi:ribosomal protein S24E
MKILKQEKNPFLHREEFSIEIQADSNPSFEDVKKDLGKDPELSVVKKISSSFGKKVFNAEVFVYDSKELKDKIEVIPKKQRKKLEEAEKQETPSTPEQPVKQESEPKPKKLNQEIKKINKNGN